MHNRFVHSNGSVNPPCTNLCPTIHHRQRNKFQIYRSTLIVTNSNEIKKGSHQNGIKSAQILTQYSSYLQIYRSALIVTREPARVGLKKEGRMGNRCYLIPRVVHAGVVGVRRADVRHRFIGVPFRLLDLTATGGSLRCAEDGCAALGAAVDDGIRILLVDRRQRRGRGFLIWRR